MISSSWVEVKKFNQVHEQSEDGWRCCNWVSTGRWGVFKQLTDSRTSWRAWDEMISWSVLNQLSSCTWRPMKRNLRGCDVKIRWEVFEQLTKFTYMLDTDEHDGIGWSYGSEMRGIQTGVQVHVLAGEDGTGLTESREASWNFIFFKFKFTLRLFTYTLEMECQWSGGTPRY